MKNTRPQIDPMTIEQKFPGAQISMCSLYQQDNALLSFTYPSCSSIIHQKSEEELFKSNMSKGTPIVEGLVIVYNFI